MSESVGVGLDACIERDVYIDAAPDIVFPYLVESDLYIRWEGTKAELDPRPGGIYLVRVHEGAVARGEFVEVSPPDRVIFTLGWEDPSFDVAPGSTLVEITLAAEGAGTRLVVRQSGLPQTAVEGHVDGWAHYLNRLAVVAAGSDPGPDPRVTSE